MSSGSSGGGGGGGLTFPKWVTQIGSRYSQYKDEDISIGRAITYTLVSFVLPGLVGMFIIQPAEWMFGIFAWVADRFADAYETATAGITSGLSPVEGIILGGQDAPGVIDSVYQSVESGLMDAGLGAPFAATLTVVVFATVLTVLLYVLLRVSADAVPGLGGLIR